MSINTKSSRQVARLSAKVVSIMLASATVSACMEDQTEARVEAALRQDVAKNPPNGYPVSFVAEGRKLVARLGCSGKNVGERTCALITDEEKGNSYVLNFKQPIVVPVGAPASTLAKN